MPGISFTCLPHFQMCAPMSSAAELPVSARQLFDTLGPCHGAAEALARAFEGFEYSSMVPRGAGEYIEEHDGMRYFDSMRGAEMPMPEGFALLEYACKPDSYFWALYATEKRGVATRHGAVDVQLVRMVWWFPCEGGGPLWVAEWSFSNSPHVTWNDAKGE